MDNQQTQALKNARSQRLPRSIRDNINDEGIVYSPNKYRETEGIKGNSKQSKNFPPEMLQIVTTNRKNRRCIRGTAQRYYMVSKDIRTQCSEVRECHTLGGVFTIVLRKKYICDSEGEVEKKKLIGMYCWVHNEETRKAYDTYRMIDVLGKDGFKEESEQYRMQPAIKQEINIEAKLKK